MHNSPSNSIKNMTIASTSKLAHPSFKFHAHRSITPDGDVKNPPAVKNAIFSKFNGNRATHVYGNVPGITVTRLEIRPRHDTSFCSDRLTAPAGHGETERVSFISICRLRSDKMPANQRVLPRNLSSV